MPKGLTQKEFSEVIEAVKRASFAEGYARAKLELGQEGTETPEVPPQEPVFKESADLYISKTTSAETKKRALDYLKDVQPRAVGPTEIIRNTEQRSGVSLSYTTLRRALDRLMAEGKVEMMSKEPSRWRYRDADDATKVAPFKART